MNEEKARFSILISDDHPVMREGLRMVIAEEPDFEVVGEASGGKEAIELFRQLRPDLLLIDLEMPGVDGIQATAAILAEFPDATIVMLGTYPGDTRIVRAFTLGATSYILKSARRSEIINAIRSALVQRRTALPRSGKN